MTGLLLMLVGIVWIVIVSFLVRFKADFILPKPPWRKVAQVGLFAVLLPLPLIDEIVGGWQFARLCEANVVRVNMDTARGRRVYEEKVSVSTPVPGTWVNVKKLPFRFLDATTGEVVVSFNQFHAEGGRLFPGFDSGHEPLTFKGECHPTGTFDKGFAANLGLIEVDKPQAN